MRVLVCDDDEHIRLVIDRVITDRGYEVVAEAESAVEAIDLLDRLSPDVVIVDLALLGGSGVEVVEAALGRGRGVVVFSAYLDSFNASAFPEAVTIVKPDFAAVEAALDGFATRFDAEAAWSTTQPDRRRGSRADSRTGPVGAVEEPSDFYRALADAWSGDTIMGIRLDGPGAEPGDIDLVARTVRTVVRAQDHIMCSGETLTLLLVGGGPTAADGVAQRLTRALRERAGRIGWSHRSVVIQPDESPSDAFDRLRVEPLRIVAPSDTRWSGPAPIV